ncbi:hypothetical protein [Microtetraspora malaysiensis]|uniref:hypothetical protein n=1 Tax=Microtetraspora malaysiensis TaxID=161358 RepID=UPI000A6EC98F|nr:hypothetical protein [Microtetraspora malaysiensis]
MTPARDTTAPRPPAVIIDPGHEVVVKPRQHEVTIHSTLVQKEASQQSRSRSQ